MFSTFDIVIFVIIAASAMSGLYKGLINIFINLLCFLASIVAAIYLFPYVQSVFTGIIDNELSVYILSVIVSYICSLGTFALIARKASSMLKGISYGFFDRALGLVVGIVRGIIISSIIYVITAIFSTGSYLHAKDASEMIENLGKKEYPAWLAKSRTTDSLEKLTKKATALLPESALTSIKFPGGGPSETQDNIEE